MLNLLFFHKAKRMLEGANINKSPLALGNCINILEDKTKKGLFVPYHDSKPTRLLKYLRIPVVNKFPVFFFFNKSI